MPSEAYVYDAVRTPRGRGRDTGALHGVKPISLVVGLIDALRERNPGLDTGRLDDLVMGIVTPVGEQGGDLPRAAALLAGLPDHGRRGAAQPVLRAPGWRRSTPPPRGSAPAGSTCCSPAGVESMSRVPMGSDGGAWAMDPETALATSFVPQGISADLIATLEGFTRDDVDALRAAVAGAGRQGLGRRALRPLGRAGPRPQRPGRSSPSTSTCARTPPGRAWPSSRRPSPTIGERGRLRRGGAAEVPLAGGASTHVHHAGNSSGHRGRRGAGADRLRARSGGSSG